MSVLVDTSIWSLALRRNPENRNPSERAAVTELTSLVKEGRAKIIGLIRQEILSGIKTPVQYEKLRAAMKPYRDEPVNTADYEAAAKASNECRARGVALSLPDMLICAMSMDRDWPIFTTDPDFRLYARVLPIKLHGPRA